MALQDREDTFFDETEGYNDYAKSQTPDAFGERITYSEPTDGTTDQTGTGSDAAQPSGMDLTDDEDDGLDAFHERLDSDTADTAGKLDGTQGLTEPSDILDPELGATTDEPKYGRTDIQE